MNFLFSEVSIGKNRKLGLPVIIWFGLALIAVTLELSRHSYNNFIIFEGAFWHSVHRMDLYAQYPGLDYNHYGPFFAIVIAPFALLPDWLGVFLWAMTNAFVLFYAIKLLGFDKQNFYIMLLIAAMELMTATHHVQFNPMVGAWIILSYVMIDREKDIWGTLFIAAGFMTKLYGVAGLTFFLFSRHKIKFIGYFIMWMAIFFCLPMVLSSPSFVIQSYKGWWVSLHGKDARNALQSVGGGMQDISVMGILRRVFHTAAISDAVVLLPAFVLFGLPLLRFSQYQFSAYRLRYLALVLISVVIYSSSAESVTYVIPAGGLALWYVLQEEKAKWVNGLLIFILFLTSFSATDLCPPYIRVNIVRAFALKALPSFIVWCLLIKDVATVSFRSRTTTT